MKKDNKKYKKDPNNARSHDSSNKALVKKSIKELGAGRSIVVDNTGTIVGGNQTYESAMELGLNVIEVESDGTDLIVVKRIDLDYDDKKRKELAVADNSASDSSEFVESAFDNEYFDDVNIEDWDVEFKEESEEEEKHIEAKEDDFDGGVPKIPVTVRGDLYELVSVEKGLTHRVHCGDSTSVDDVEKLMNGDKADMVFTDPPYLMDFKGNVSWDDKNGAQPTFNSKHGTIKNDKMSKSEGDAFLDDINNNISLYCKGAFYITFYRLGIGRYFSSLDRAGLQVRSLIIWEKGNHTLSNSDYMSRYEPIFYGWVKEHNFYGGNNGMDVWNIGRTKKNELHPTMKPIPLCEKALKDSSKEKDIVLDFFLGSGTLLVASEQLSRTCYGQELDEKYMDVIVNRWVTYMKKEGLKYEIKLNGEPISKERLNKITGKEEETVGGI